MWRKVLRELRFTLPIWFVQLILCWLPDNRFTIRLRGALVGLILPGIPRKLAVARGVTLLGADQLRIGRNVYFARGCWINAHGGLTIGDEVKFSPYVVVSSTNHGFRDGSVARGGIHRAPISIGHGSWIGSHSTITAGANVGAGNLIGANSVVIGNTPENVLVGGVPGRVIRARVDNPGEAP